MIFRGKKILIKFLVILIAIYKEIHLVKFTDTDQDFNSFPVHSWHIIAFQRLQGQRTQNFKSSHEAVFTIVTKIPRFKK